MQPAQVPPDGAPPPSATRPPGVGSPGPAPATPRIRGVAWSERGSRPLGGPADIADALRDEGTRVWVDVTAPIEAESRISPGFSTSIP